MPKFIILVGAAWLVFSVYYITRPYQLSASDLEVSDKRSPEENQDLIGKLCVGGQQPLCECIMPTIYARTTRLERAAYIYADSWIWAWSVKLGAQSIGVGDAELAKVSQQVGDKVAHIIAGCKK
jgi:hypothetical protein